MTKLTEVKGIGPKTAEALMRLGISDVEDMISCYPRDYEGFPEPKPLYQLVPGTPAAVEGVLSKDATMNYYNGMKIVNAYLSDMTGRLQLSWYNLPYIRQSLKAGSHYVFCGRVYEKNGRMMMYQPKLYPAERFRTEYMGRLFPVYPLTKGVTNALMRKLAEAALSGMKTRREYLPEALRERCGLCEINYAVQRIHFPEDREALLHAKKRLCFDEFFFFLLGTERMKREQSAFSSEYRCRPDLRLLRFLSNLPFELTAAQQKAWREIHGDLCSGHVMNRLVEGDVGSGKTVVALLAMLEAGLNGYQSVMMAPTEVLARQHYENICRYLNASELPLSVLLLTGSMSAAEKRAACERIRTHGADLIVGTHAVFQEKVVYDRLGLVVTDEQHRFGVGQRERLKEKGGLPHMLVMSATPIPRTLAIILYGELKRSVIDVLPGGRKEIKNCVVGPNYRKTAYRFLLEELKKGHQAYVVCPMIEASGEEAGETGERLSGGVKPENVTEYAEMLRGLFPEEYRIGILHGRMRTEEKDEIMSAFKRGEIRLLVSTTVIEVGVDVPNATVMMIENADRFGLAQLHQLRGRVGRGSEQSYCIMVNTSKEDAAAERLEILNRSNDGFYIAEEDLRLRGPGDIFGIRQSGDIGFQLADIYRDAALLKLAKKEAELLLSEDPELSRKEHGALSEALSAYLSEAPSAG